MANDPKLTQEQRQSLIELARAAIAAQFDPDMTIPTCHDQVFRQKRGAFVTLTIGGALRGCIGRIEPRDRLWNVIIEMAPAAAFRDPRFMALTRNELDQTEIEISVLSPLVPVDDPAEIVVGTHGLFIRKGLFSGLLLPQVASSRNWSVMTFIEETCRKAGLRPNDWQQQDAELFMFSAEVFSEKESESGC